MTNLVKLKLKVITQLLDDTRFTWWFVKREIELQERAFPKLIQLDLGTPRGTYEATGCTSVGDAASPCRRLRKAKNETKEPKRNLC